MNGCGSGILSRLFKTGSMELPHCGNFGIEIHPSIFPYMVIGW
jgi:hypothetical protein